MTTKMLIEAYTWAQVSITGFRTKLRARLTDMVGSERGGVAAEYALLVSLIAIVIVAGAFFLGGAINDRLQQTGDCVAGAPAGAC
ncbi:MAG TPA: hypothetical protein VK962_08000 [Actinomycetota bacterium]|nr:hypothetical protein [Actinomycetota bacterium]